MWTQSINLRKITDLKNQRQTDQLVIEKQTNVYLNNDFIVELTHTPQFEKELVLGYLIVTGKIGFEFSSIKVEDNNVYVEAPKGVCLPIKNKSIKKPDKHIIFEITAYFQQAAVLFKKTAITESAAFSSDNNLLFNSEDLTQDTAFYKLVGRYVMQSSELSFNELTLLISAKLDLALIKKVSLLGIAMVISRTAPTKQALDYAANHNISVVGFARGRRYNWYTT